MADAATPAPMDEVLASIRRIITEQPSFGIAGRALAESEGDDDVLELGEPAEPAPPVLALAPVQPPAVAAPAPVAEEAADPAALLSARSQAASQKALAALTGLSIDPRAADNTLDGLVREMLRPMLKDWLDAHLPELVERLVAREVARISGR